MVKNYNKAKDRLAKKEKAAAAPSPTFQTRGFANGNPKFA